jgi:hypothetical protein
MTSTDKNLNKELDNENQKYLEDSNQVVQNINTNNQMRIFEQGLLNNENFIDSKPKFVPSNTNLSILSQLKRQRKQMDKLIHIYASKVLFDNIGSNRKESTLPFIIHNNKEMNSSRSAGKRKFKSSGSEQKPKFSLEEEKLKLQKMREVIQKNKEKKQQEAKEMKQANRLMKENFLILKDKLKEENLLKKKIVDARYEIIKDSIESYKSIKRDYIESMIAQEIKYETKILMSKNSELFNLRNEHEIKSNGKNQKHNNNTKHYSNKDIKNYNMLNKSYLFLTQNKLESSTFVTDIKMN